MRGSSIARNLNLSDPNASPDAGETVSRIETAKRHCRMQATHTFVIMRINQLCDGVDLYTGLQLRLL